MSDTRKNLLVICGPTASGKTRLAVSCAIRRQGEIVSADSRQVYRGMDIGTGKDLEEYTTATGSVPYHLIDIAEPSEIYTLYHYQQNCYAVLGDIWRRKRLPILVGGSGLYIEAVLRNYRIPNVPEDPALRCSLMRKTKNELINQLKDADRTLYAHTDISSKKRIVRALEIAIYAQNHCVQWGVDRPPHINPIIIGVHWPRDILQKRIDQRLKARLERGMIDEVRRLLASGIPADRFDYFGMEYKQVARYLNNSISYDTMYKELARDIHRLAKRQETYFRGMARRGLPIQLIEGVDGDMADEILVSNTFSYTDE